MKPTTKKKSKNPEISKKTKLERIMFEENIKVNQLHEGTGIAYPTLFNMIKGRKTTFRKRTIRDMETYLKRPAENFLGFEGDKYVPKKISLIVNTFAEREKKKDAEEEVKKAKK